MLTPQELRNIPEDVVSIFEECEDEILKLIGERIRAVGYLNTVSLWQLIKRKESLLFKRNVTRTLSKYTGLSQRQIRRVFKKAGAKALLHDDTFLKAITTKDTRKRNRTLDRILKEAYEQTNGTLHNWTGTTANNATNHFVHAMDKAALQVQSGAFSYDEAIRRATRDLADHMDYVTYESGHKDTLEVASRRAVRTGVNQMASKLTLERCKQVGAEFVETTAHVGARETDSEDCTNHSWWQGKVFHLSEEGSVGEDGKFYPGFFSYDQAGYGYGAGICGWNCRHSFHPFIPGVSEPIYTPEELAKLSEKNIEYEGKKYSRYEIDQKQRGLERQVRKYKRREILAESVGDEQEVARNKAFVRKYQDELDKFTKESGNRRDYERERETVGKPEPDKMSRNRVYEGTKWQKEGNILTSEQIQELYDYAKSKNIILEQSFMGFDGDPELVKDFIDHLCLVQEKYPKLLEDKTKIHLSVSYRMDDKDYAETVDNKVTINGYVYRNKSLLENDYERLMKKRFFVKGSNYHHIGIHESAHVVANVYQMPGNRIRKKLFGKMEKVDYAKFIKKHVSTYATKNGKELLAESYVAYSIGSKDEIVLKVLKFCGIL